MILKSVPSARPPYREHQRGFTLVELLAVMAVTAILITVGLPQLSQFSATRAANAHVAMLASAMRLARSEAVRSGTPVTICPSFNAESVARPSCNGGPNDWASGWVIFSDRGVLNVIEQGDRIIRVQGPMQDSGGIQSQGGTTVNFFPTGISLGGQRSFSFLPLLSSSSPNYSEVAQRMCVDNIGSTIRRKFSEAC